MTGGPVTVPDVMCSETNVTITSLQIKSTSSVEPAKEPAANQNDVITSRSTTDVTLTSLTIQRTNTTTSSEGNGEGDNELHVNSVSHRRMSETPKVVTFGGLPPDINGYEQLLKVRPSPGSSATVEDCSKLVFQLSKELAVLHGLSGGIGGDSDSNKLREELKLSRFRACTLAQQNAAALVPLFRSKGSLKKDEASETERLYRIFSGCLEYLVYLLHKIKSLLSIFHINNETCFLIQTGITDPVGFVHKTSSTCTVLKEGAGSAKEGTSQSQDDMMHLNGDLKSMQQLLYVVNSACDVQPWDVAEEAQDAQKQRKTSIQPSSRRESRKCSSRALSGSLDKERQSLLSVRESDQHREPSTTDPSPSERSSAVQYPQGDVSSAGPCCWPWLWLCGQRQREECPADRVLILINDMPDPLNSSDAWLHDGKT